LAETNFLDKFCLELPTGRWAESDLRMGKTQEISLQKYQCINDQTATVRMCNPIKKILPSNATIGPALIPLNPV
jgi:hypothetical protein